MSKYFIPFLILFACYSCKGQANREKHVPAGPAITHGDSIRYDTTARTIHVRVALCDNKYQGIVPVPAKMGNGQDPDNNLYWGWGYGVRTYFRKSNQWKLLRTENPGAIVRERLVFKHVYHNYYLVADGYDGQYIKNCTIDFLNSLSGQLKDTLHVNNTIIGINGNARMLSLIGHNGLMDFNLPELAANEDGRKRDCIILACISKKYFTPHIKKANANPVLWTTGLMGPEAYTLHDALTGYVRDETVDRIRRRAATAYATYTKCSARAAMNLLVTGF